MVEEAVFIKMEDTISLKKALAKKLYSRNIDQPRISEILNLSQPMVSNYCSSEERIPQKIQDLVEKIIEKIIHENIPVSFHTCLSFSKQTIEGEFYIVKKNEILTDETKKIVDNLTEAFLIISGKDIRALIPEIKINIAMAKENAETPDDVAAFLNGLIVVDDKIVGYNGIRFGKSKHLSSLLISLKKTLNVNAIMNLAYISDIEKTSLKFDFLTKDFKLKNKQGEIDVLLHKGDFGIEPCSYILGHDAVDVVNKVLKIKEEIS